MSLPIIQNDRRAKFEEVIASPHAFDYFGMERGGHYAVLMWLRDMLPGKAPHILGASTGRPGIMGYHPSGWFSMAPPPEAVSIAYRPDAELATHKSRLPSPRAIVLARDFRNCWASRKRFRENRNQIIFRLDGVYAMIWKQYAEQVLGDADHLGYSNIGISYDRWFKDKTYREAVVDDINNTFGWSLDASAGESILSKVNKSAGGSSFDGLTFDGQAQKMKVLDRWRDYANDELLTKLYTPEIEALNRRLIGEA